MLALLTFAGAYKLFRKYYRRFCIKVLWKRFGVRTAAYNRWHDERAARMQEALNNEHGFAAV